MIVTVMIILILIFCCRFHHYTCICIVYTYHMYIYIRIYNDCYSRYDTTRTVVIIRAILFGTLTPLRCHKKGARLCSTGPVVPARRSFLGCVRQYELPNVHSVHQVHQPRMAVQD
jgi:hypothetical protein